MVEIGVFTQQILLLNLRKSDLVFHNIYTKISSPGIILKLQVSRQSIN